MLHCNCTCLLSTVEATQRPGFICFGLPCWSPVEKRAVKQCVVSHLPFTWQPSTLPQTCRERCKDESLFCSFWKKQGWCLDGHRRQKSVMGKCKTTCEFRGDTGHPKCKRYIPPTFDEDGNPTALGRGSAPQPTSRKRYFDKKWNCHGKKHGMQVLPPMYTI